MSERKHIGSALVPPIMREIAWAERYGGFNDPLGRSLLRARQLGAGDDQIDGMILERVGRVRVQEVLGQLEPFSEPRLSDGELMIGRSRRGHEIWLQLQSLTAGTLIAMRTGGGKSNLLRLLTPQVAARGARVWTTDQWKKEGRHLRGLFHEADQDLVILRPSEMKYDPLHPGKCDPRHHLANVTNVLTGRLGLGERARTILYQTVHALYGEYGVWEGRKGAFPCLFDAWVRIRGSTGLNAPAREAILDRLGAVLIELTPWRLGWSSADLARFNICFELSGASEPVKHVLLEPLLYSVFQFEIERGLVNAPLGLFIALDDAQAYAQQDSGGRMTPLDTAAGLFRSTGLAMCLCVQTMRGLSKKLVPNLSGLRIMGPMGCHDDYAGLGSDMGLSREKIDWATTRTSPGTLVAKTDEWPEPFVVRVPHVTIPRKVSDEEVTDSVRALESLRAVPAAEYTNWTPDHVIRIARPGAGGPSAAAATEVGQASPAGQVKKEELDYLESIVAEPFLKVTERDARLGLSAWKGNQIRQDLSERSLVKSVAVNPGGRGRRFQLLELTSTAIELLNVMGMPTPRGLGRGGVEHQFWSHTVRDWLMRRGASGTVEDESMGARVDIAVLTAEGIKLAIEVETSPGHELRNVEKDLEADYAMVVCLVEDPKRVAVVQRKVSEALTSQQSSRVLVGRLVEYERVLLKCLDSVEG